MNPIPLEGCTPEPLMNYLKALGVLKIVVEQELDPTARAFWKNGHFYLYTELSKEELVDAFIEKYKPSPVITPWNEAAGFKKAKGADVDMVRKISESKDERYSRYKGFTKDAKDIAQRFSKKEKDDLILTLRNQMPDEVIQWIDACGSYAGDGYQYAPFLGTGGNVGKMDISINYLKQIAEVFDEKNSKKLIPWLRSSLFATNEVPNVESTISQFSPGRAGGANATQGTEGKSMINPWDFILMIEGSLFLGSSTSRKLSSQQSAKSVFPFTVEDSAVGNSKLTSSDLSNRKGRGEIWMPLWERPAALGELKSLFAEGRAQFRGRQATSGLDFARAVAGLGVDRGIKTFMRFSIVEFVTAGVMAVPLGQFEVAAKNNASLLRQIDPWLDTYRLACNKKVGERFVTSPRIRSALGEIERSIFDYCQQREQGGDHWRFQRILIALGNAERLVASAPKFRTNAKGLAPLTLSSEWLKASDDNSSEFRIALALASMWTRELGGIRIHLEDVEKKGTKYQWVDRNHSAVWTNADLNTNLAAILHRRVMNADKMSDSSLALRARHRTNLSTIGEFLAGNLDQDKISNLLWGLALCDVHQYSPEKPTEPLKEEYREPIPAAYSMLKLLFQPEPGKSDAAVKSTSRPDLTILNLLRADRMGDAMQRAVRLLRGRSYRPKPSAMGGFPTRDDELLECSTMSFDSNTLAAALLIPIYDASAEALKKQILRQNESSPS